MSGRRGFEKDLDMTFWTFKKECHCGGVLAVHYTGKNNYQLKVKPNSRTYITKDNLHQIGRGKLENIKADLQKLYEPTTTN